MEILIRVKKTSIVELTKAFEENSEIRNYSYNEDGSASLNVRVSSNVFMNVSKLDTVCNKLKDLRC